MQFLPIYLFCLVYHCLQEILHAILPNTKHESKLMLNKKARKIKAALQGGAKRPQGLPHYSSPPLLHARPPRCPPFVEVTSSDQLLPYLEHVAQRPYNHGLNACWDLTPGERVLLRVDNWHSELTIEACKRILEKYNVKYEIKYIDRGPIPQWVGADEVEYYLFRTKELAEWMDMWEEV